MGTVFGASSANAPSPMRWHATGRCMRRAGPGSAAGSPIFPTGSAGAALARLIITVGDLDYAPRGERLDRLHAHLKNGAVAGRTLGGCRIRAERDAGWWRAESSSLPPDVPFIDGSAVWDRFVVRLPADMAGNGLRLGPLGSGARPDGLPPGLARPALAAIHDLDGVVAIPHLGWVRPGADLKLKGAKAWTFPRQALASAEFAVA